MYQNELYHYGVKGMKWGVRHDRQGSEGRRKSTKSAAEKLFAATHPVTYSAHRRYKAYKQKKFDRSEYSKVKKMSNEEIQDVVKRINLEQSYLNAIERDQRSAKRASETILDRFGRETVEMFKIDLNRRARKKVQEVK